LIRSGDFVVDIGANIGTHTVALANLVGSGGLVVALEAQRQVYNYLVAKRRGLAVPSASHFDEAEYPIRSAHAHGELRPHDQSQGTHRIVGNFMAQVDSGRRPCATRVQ